MASTPKCSTLESLINQLETELQNANHDIDHRVDTYNRLVRIAATHLNLPHPVACVQFVKADTLEGNDYNPNKVAPPEMRLLETSISKDGVTMAIVATKPRKDGKRTVVDGFHRTTIIQNFKEIKESLHGYAPVVELDKSVEQRIAATVRHNMARGTHQVELSAKLVTVLTKHHWSNERISEELGMDADEVLRLKQITGLAEAFRDREFSKAWE